MSEPQQSHSVPSFANPVAEGDEQGQRLLPLGRVLTTDYYHMHRPAGSFVSCRSLNGLGLEGQLPLSPQVWGPLSTLTSLQLGNNKLSGYLPSGISALTQLRSLDMSSNDFNGAPWCI